MLEPVIARYRDRNLPKLFRGDAGFTSPELYDLLEAEGFGYAIRLKSNPNLERHIAHLLQRPGFKQDGKPDVRYYDFTYHASSWDRTQRVLAGGMV